MTLPLYLAHDLGREPIRELFLSLGDAPLALRQRHRRDTDQAPQKCGGGLKSHLKSPDQDIH